MNKNSSRNSYHHPLKTHYREDAQHVTKTNKTTSHFLFTWLSLWPKRALLTGGLAPWVFTPGTRMRPARRRTTYLPLLLGWAPRLTCLFTLQQSFRHPPSIRAGYIRREKREGEQSLRFSIAIVHGILTKLHNESRGTNSNCVIVWNE